MVEFDEDGRVIGLDEKPAEPKSNCAVTALYFYDGKRPDDAAAIAPSPRGELEITDATAATSSAASCMVERLVRGYAGSTPARTSRCCRPANFIETIERAPGRSRSRAPRRSPTRTAGSTARSCSHSAEPLRRNGYGEYLLALADGAFAGTD